MSSRRLCLGLPGTRDNGEVLGLRRLLGRHPRTRRAAANPRGGKFSRRCRSPAALHGSRPRCWQAGLGSDAREYFAIWWQLAGKPALRGHEHSLPRRNKARTGDLRRGGCKTALRRFAAEQSNPTPCSDRYLPSCSSSCVPAVAPEAKAEKRTVRGHDVGRAGGQRLFLTGPAGPAPVTPALGTVLLEVASWPGEGEDNCAGRALDHHSEENGAPKPSSYRVDSKGRSGHSASARR